MRLSRVAAGLALVAAAAAAAAAAATDAPASASQRRYGVMTAPVPDGLTPRYIAESFDPVPIIKRAGSCPEGRHPCLDVLRGDQCCDDSAYCFVDKKGDPKCCPIGASCSDNNPCDSLSYFCTQAQTISGSIRTRETCCGKSCPMTSRYLCPSNLGGNCCHYGSECQKGGLCVETVEPTRSAELTPIVEGCTTSQYKCEDGEGCCNNNQKCTEVSNTAYCAAGTPTGTGIEFIEESEDDGLSDGAKAGIGVGAAVGGGLIIGLATWFCLRRRKRRGTESQQTGSQTVAGGGVAGGDNMTEYTEASRRPTFPRGGPTQDYFGPAAVAGPFTDGPGGAAMPHSSPGRAVPSQPQKPGDIAAPVEIDSTGRTPGTDDGGWMSPNSFSDFQTTPMPESAAGRMELYGSDAPPPQQLSPLTPPREVPR